MYFLHYIPVQISEYFRILCFRILNILAINSNIVNKQNHLKIVTKNIYIKAHSTITQL